MYDSEDNHILVRDMLDAFSVIPARYVQYMYQYEVQVGDTEKTNEGWLLFQTVVWVNEIRMKP